MKHLNKSFIINSKPKKVYKRAVCPHCLAAEVVIVTKKVQTVKCHDCGGEYEVKNEII